MAEHAADGSGYERPVYVIGTEVPIPGGTLEEIDGLEVTKPKAALDTVEVHRAAFRARQLDNAFQRVVAAVVQPGVEFGNANVVVYDRAKAHDLSAVLDQINKIVFEAHSTDYQPPEALWQLVEDGFAILKVGPGVTFALREALYGLDQIADILNPVLDGESLHTAMERIMVADPPNWANYYHGSERQLFVQRHYSYSDRIRYYWTKPEAQAAVQRLFARLDGVDIPETLISQYLALLYPAVAAGKLPARPKALCIAAIRHALRPYALAARQAA